MQLNYLLLLFKWALFTSTHTLQLFSVSDWMKLSAQCSFPSIRSHDMKAGRNKYFKNYLIMSGQAKPVFCLLTKRALFTPITHCFRFAIVKLKWTFSVQWIRKLLISETVIVCCSAKKWLTLNISNCIRPPLGITHKAKGINGKY